MTKVGAEVKAKGFGALKTNIAMEVDGRLMAYRPDATADYVGLQRITGTLAGRSGTFVLSTVGTFDGQEASGTWTVLAGSGTDELAGLTGTGTFSAPSGGEPSVSLDYDL